MKRVSTGLIIILLSLGFLAGCSSPEEQFIEAAVKEGSVTDRKVLACAADKLKADLPEDQFQQLIEDLEMIADKKKSKGDASLKLMGAMTLATAGCAVSDFLGLGDK